MAATTPSPPSTAAPQLAPRPSGAPVSAWAVPAAWVSVFVALEVAGWVAPLGRVSFAQWSVPVTATAVVAAVTLTVSLVRPAGGRLGLGWCTPADRSASVALAAASVAAFATSAVWLPQAFSAVVAATAAGEEVVWRAVLPALCFAVVSRAGAPRGVAAGAAVAVPSVVFAVLPGHAAQFGPLGPLPFVAMAALAVWLLWRGASLRSVAAYHGCFNAAGFALAGGAPLWWRPVAVAAPVAVFAAAALRSKRPRAST